jgi:hypothetical protein
MYQTRENGTFGKREKELAKLVIDERLSLDQICAIRHRSRGHIGREISFGAYLLAKEDQRAKALSDLMWSKGIGPVKAIRRFLAI